MTAWGVVAVCGIGGGAAGPLLDSSARRFRRSVSVALPAELPVSPVGAESPLPSGDVPVDPATEPVPSRRSAAVLEGGAVTLVTAAACALAAVRLGAVPQLAGYCILVGALVLVSVTDLRTGLVPRRIVYAASVIVGIALLCACAANGTWRPMLEALVGAAAAFVAFAVLWWVAPKAMGFGDVRLAGLCGGALGWMGFAVLYLGFLAAFVAGAVAGVAVLFARGHRRFPFAPALAVGTVFGVLWGPWLGGLWLHTG